MDENINLTILNEVNKASKMGMNSINYVMDKVEDETMKENLSTQYAGYGNLLEKINTQFEKYGEIPDEEPAKDKMMGWMGVQMNTITDKSNSHIAEMMIQGSSMGITKCQKLINHNPQAEQPVKDILNNFVQFSQNSIEQMKQFL